MATTGETGRHASKDEHARDLERRRRRVSGVLAGLEFGEDAVHLVVGVVLMVVAVGVLYQYGHDFYASDSSFPVKVTELINGLLFVIIIMELLRTVVAHFDFEGFQLKPFLIIGIISAVRHILTVGARESLGAGGTEGGSAFRHAQVELGVNAAVVLALVVGLILVRRTDTSEE